MPLPELAGIDAWLVQREAGVPALRPGCAKRIVWAQAVETQTEWAVVYVHGFSATGEELRPLPDLVAQALGANLFFTRLDGHGQDGPAMGRATLAAWQSDIAEAFEIARVIGRRVLFIGCSTGCPLLTLALAGGEKAAGCAMISPNFGLRHRVAQILLDLPGARHYGHFIAGKERAFDVISPAHGQYWTTRYPTKAVYPMGEAVRKAHGAKLEQIATPILVALNDADQVINPARARQVMRRWGGPVTHVPLIQGPDDDAMGHVMAGDIFSPKQTAPLAQRIIAWAQALP